MGNYIARRLLLMIPTLIGITFLVFMLIALSPGGIGAGLKVSAGGQMEATSRANIEAYFDDRYGLKDPVITQYIRWLARVSPLKFGARDQIDPTGERIRPPRPLKDPVLWTWFTAELPEAANAEPPLSPGMEPEARTSLYRRLTNQYAQRRSAYITSTTLLKQAVVRYARAAEVEGAVDRKGELVPEALADHEPDRSSPEWPEIERLGAGVIAAYSAAQDSLAIVRAAFAQKPYPEAGVGIGPVSLAMPDFGVAFSRSRPVLDLIGDALPVTLLLNFIAFPIIYAIAIPGGMLAATRTGTWKDTGLGMLFVGLWSVPTVWAGVLAIGFLASREYLGAFPVSGLHANDAEAMRFLPGRGADGAWQWGFVFDTLWHVALPVLCLVYGGFAVLAKQTRAAMLDNFNADYVRTAKAKGVSGKDIVFRHVFRNSLLPVITMFATIFPAMLAGSVVIERIFTIPGMGSLILDAIGQRDRELILANTLMIAVVNLLALLLADILYAMADPRITYD
jgi:microcin C transport system permease protein